jgi:6-phosphogluconolactonase
MHVHRIAIANAQVTMFPTADELFSAAADEFFGVITAAQHENKSPAIALSGGSTPRSLYELVARRAASEPSLKQIDWRNVHLFFGDERSVPPSDKDSNYRMARESLLSNAALGAAHVHRVHAELPPEEAARQYEGDLRQHFGAELPAFDLILLGLGPDGHTASLFPGTAGLNVTDRWVIANDVPQQHTTRISFTYPVLNNAAEVLFLVAGAEKSTAMSRALIARDVPAAGVQPSGRLLWFTDAAAGSEVLRQREL